MNSKKLVKASSLVMLPLLLTGCVKTGVNTTVTAEQVSYKLELQLNLNDFDSKVFFDDVANLYDAAIEKLDDPEELINRFGDPTDFRDNIKLYKTMLNAETLSTATDEYFVFCTNEKLNELLTESEITLPDGVNLSLDSTKDGLNRGCALTVTTPMNWDAHDTLYRAVELNDEVGYQIMSQGATIANCIGGASSTFTDEYTNCVDAFEDEPYTGLPSEVEIRFNAIFDQLGSVPVQLQDGKYEINIPGLADVRNLTLDSSIFTEDEIADFNDAIAQMDEQLAQVDELQFPELQEFYAKYLDIYFTVNFPGHVTSASEGGKISGNSVTWNLNDAVLNGVHATAKTSAGFNAGYLVAIVVLAGIMLAVFLRSSKKEAADRLLVENAAESALEDSDPLQDSVFDDEQTELPGLELNYEDFQE